MIKNHGGPSVTKGQLLSLYQQLFHSKAIKDLTLLSFQALGAVT